MISMGPSVSIEFFVRKSGMAIVSMLWMKGNKTYLSERIVPTAI